MKSFYSNPDLYHRFHLPSSQETRFYKNFDRDGVVFELASGTSRLASCFKSSKYFGLDINRDMLSYAQQKISTLKLVQASFLNIPIRSSSCDLMILALNSHFHMNSSEEFSDCLSQIHRVLSEDGYLLFDSINPEHPELLKDCPEWSGLGRVQWNHKLVHLHEKRRRVGERQLEVFWKWSHKGEIVHEESSYFWIPDFYETCAQLQKNGFEVQESFGDFSKSPYAPESKRLILLCKRV